MRVYNDSWNGSLYDVFTSAYSPSSLWKANQLIRGSNSYGHWRCIPMDSTIHMAVGRLGLDRLFGGSMGSQPLEAAPTEPSRQLACRRRSNRVCEVQAVFSLHNAKRLYSADLGYSYAAAG